MFDLYDVCNGRKKCFITFVMKFSKQQQQQKNKKKTKKKKKTTK
jgi:hypothetical protein